MITTRLHCGVHRLVDETTTVHSQLDGDAASSHFQVPSHNSAILNHHAVKLLQRGCLRVCLRVFSSKSLTHIASYEQPCGSCSAPHRRHQPTACVPCYKCTAASRRSCTVGASARRTHTVSMRQTMQRCAQQFSRNKDCLHATTYATICCPCAWHWNCCIGKLHACSSSIGTQPAELSWHGCVAPEWALPLCNLVIDAPKTMTLSYSMGRNDMSQPRWCPVHHSSASDRLPPCPL
jgi:hypothetical protein